MTLGIMQPYFFPYVGYFELIGRTDAWVVFDTVQYIRHGWVNRNRILHPSAGWQYVIVPLRRHSRDTDIGRIEVAAGDAWRRRILGQLDHYRRTAPHFTAVRSLVEEVLSTSPSDPSLARLNVRALQAVCRYLGLPFAPRFLSELHLEMGPVEVAGDWALRISQALGATAYLNPAGGRDLFDPAKFAAAGVRLGFVEPREHVYPCRGYQPVPGLSILDVLMWRSPEEVREWLDAGGRGDRAEAPQ